MARNATVPTRLERAACSAATPAPTTTTANPSASTGIAPNRSESQPPTGRMITATTTNPAIRLAASAGVSP